MDRRHLDHFRNLLLAEQALYLTQIEHINENGLGHSLSDTATEFSTYDNHPADLGTETFEREKDLGLRSNALRQLKKIAHAMERIEAGAYGICSECGQNIPADRLEAMPSAMLCIACQSAEDALPDPYQRPIEEQVLFPPFGRTFLDGTTNVGYDGEDAWQDVAMYGTSETPQDVPGSVSYDDLYRSRDEREDRVEDTDVIIDQDGDVIVDAGLEGQPPIADTFGDPLAQPDRHPPHDARYP